MKSNKSTKIARASFKQQLIVILVISIMLVTILISILTAWRTVQTIKRTTIENSLHITNNFAAQSVLALLTGSKENGQEGIERALGFRSVIGIAIYKTNGTLLTTSENIALPSLPNKSKQIPKTTQLLDEDEDMWTYISPVTYKEDGYGDDLLNLEEESFDEKTLGYVLLQYNKYELNEIQRSIFVNNISIGTLFAVMLGFLIRFLINYLTRPLLALSETMATARDSGLYSKAEVEGASEIRQIAQTYNQLMATLEQQNIELENSKNTLESEVEIRTQELVVARDGALTANRHKSEFLANISHELRTPLQAIIGYNDLVREDLELECMDAQAEDLNKSIRSANNLLGLINNILDLSKIEAGKMDLYIKATNIKNLVNEAIDTIKPIANANNNQLSVTFGNLATILKVDRQKLLQIFLNLLSNACKFTSNGIVNFNIYNDTDFLYFSISDTGVGIAKDKLKYIFEQFTQVDGSHTRKFEGTGLGMAITQSFCQLMGGTITVESEPGKGTVFTVKQPLHNNI